MDVRASWCASCGPSDREKCFQKPKQPCKPETLGVQNTNSQELLCPLSRKLLWIFFFELAWEFCIEKWRGFLVNVFCVSVSNERKHEKSSKKSGKIRSEIRGKTRDENSKNSGNFHSATFPTKSRTSRGFDN